MLDPEAEDVHTRPEEPQSRVPQGQEPPPKPGFPIEPPLNPDGQSGTVVDAAKQPPQNHKDTAPRQRV